MANTTVLKSAAKPQLSIKVQAIATLAAIVGAVAVPQIFHVIGAVSGVGTSLGEAFLPMHLPIILVGLLAGPYAGAIAGLLGPLAFKGKIRHNRIQALGRNFGCFFQGCRTCWLEHFEKITELNRSDCEKSFRPVLYKYTKLIYVLALI